MFNNLFYNVGEKIKTSAKRFGVISVICGIITAVIFLFFGFAEMDDFGFYFIISLSSLAGGFLLLAVAQVFYGFGIIVEKYDMEEGHYTYSQKAEEKASIDTEKNDTKYSVFDKSSQVVFKICPRCGTKLHEKASRCAKCGKDL